MYKKTVTYKDFNDQTVTEDLYFNLSKDDLIKLIAEEPDFVDNLQSAFDRGDGPAIFAGIRTLLLKSYGIKSADGRSFSRKLDGVLLEDTFEDTAAYAKIMDDMIDNLDDGAALFMGIFPQDLMAQARVELAKQGKDVNQLELPGNDVTDEAPVVVAVVEPEPEVLPAETPTETPDFASMTPEEFDAWRKNNV